MNRKLVFDIGLHNGDDAAYYLQLGFGVVGVEANPILASACERRFQTEINDGRMTVLNAGVLSQSGEFRFYRNLTDDGWSSFEQAKGTKGGRWEELNVSCVTTAQLIAAYGRPFFMKVDIEGADLQTLYSLDPATAPPYMSLELNASDAILDRLIGLGYSHFKFVNGETYRPTAPIFDHQIGWRLLRKLGRMAPGIRELIGKLPVRLKSEYDPPGKFSPGGFPFSGYSSGPFGELAAGSWLGPGAALRWFDRLTRDYRRAGCEDTLWWDVHARHASHEPGDGSSAFAAEAPEGRMLYSS